MNFTIEEATQFFAEFYQGEHHFPSKLFPFGEGWMMKHHRGDIATYDYNGLTRLVLMAHDKCIRVSIAPLNFNTVKIIIWKRQREGDMFEIHPTIEDAIKTYEENKPA